MRNLQMLAQPRDGWSDSKLERRMAAIAYEAKELDMRPVAEIRAEWLRRAAEAGRREKVDPRLLAALEKTR
jgi:hypothetical protein